MRLFAIALGFIVPFASGLTIEDAKKWSVVLLFDQPLQPSTCTNWRFRCPLFSNAALPPIDFLLLEGDANSRAIEDEVRADLEKLGFTVNSRFLREKDFYAASTFEIVSVCRTSLPRLPFSHWSLTIRYPGNSMILTWRICRWLWSNL